MSSKRFKIAVATEGRGGLEDQVSSVFGRANTFTIVDVEEGVVKGVEVIENPAITYKFGAGPIVVKTLVDLGVNVVVGAELGPGASSLLGQHNIARIIVKPGSNVRDAIKNALSKM